MTTPDLSFVDGLAHDVAVQDRTPAEALAMLRARGLTADRDALAEAVAAIQLRDRFLGRDGNPYDYVGVARPRYTGPSIWDLAVAKAETELEWALRVLSAPRLQAVASS